MAVEVFQKIKSSVNRGVSTIGVKATSSLEKSKLNSQIEALESEVRTLIFSVGEKLYDSWAEGQALTSEISGLLENIKSKKKEIADLNAQVAQIDERDKQLLGNKEESVAQSVIVCPNCSSQYDLGVKFCRKCGTKLQ